MWSFVSSLLGAVFQALLSPLLGWLRSRQDRKDGEAAQAAAETKEALTVEEKVAVAEQAAPKTDGELEKSLKDGSF